MRTEGDCPPIDRMEVVGAESTGLRLLAVRQNLRQLGFTVRSMLDANLTDAEELRMRAERWDRLGSWKLAVRDYVASLARGRDVALSANNLAWCLVCVPDRGNADLAVHWAQKAVELVPGDPDYRNTLGAALYRAGRYSEAALALQQNIAQHAEMSGYDLVFLAMCQQRLGQEKSARADLARARKWLIPKNRSTPAL